jgi:23S rRNA (guanosine2251-2'-O)-methyltransferase
MAFQKYPPKAPSDEQMIYGIRPVMEALEAGKEIERIFIHRGANSTLMTELKNKLKEKNIQYQDVPVEKLNRLTRKNHQDVICFVSPITYQRLHDIIPSVYERGQTPLILLLDRITDVRNFGAIARTAECAGVHALVIPARGAAQINSDAIRTSAGALNNLVVCREKSLEESLEFLHESGLQLVAVSEKGNRYPHQADLKTPTALVMGSEENGIAGNILDLCDEKVRIPMFGKTLSLNVSVACGIILFEAVRQRLS